MGGLRDRLLNLVVVRVTPSRRKRPFRSIVTVVHTFSVYGQAAHLCTSSGLGSCPLIYLYGTVALELSKRQMLAFT